MQCQLMRGRRASPIAFRITDLSLETPTPAVPSRPQPQTRVFWAIGIALLSVGAAAPMARMADVNALAIAFWRCTIGSLAILPYLVWFRPTWPQGKSPALLLAAGIALAAHFAFWLGSLDFTSVAASVVLVCTQPIFVTLLSRVFLREKTNAWALTGIGVAFCGVVLIATDGQSTENGLLGNAMALFGALTVAIYVMIGRSARGTGMPLSWYTFVVYGSAGATLLAAAQWMNEPLTGFSSMSWTWILAVALLPQLIGHTLFNWALGYVKASTLSGTILVEPVISTALAWWLLQEEPGWPTLVGGVVALFGLGVLLRGQKTDLGTEVPTKAETSR